jgi:hypothetical protein
MANILASNRAPLDSVIIWCTTVTTIILSTFCSQTDYLHLVPELTDLSFAVLVKVRPQGPWVPLCRDLPPDVSEAAAVPLSCLGAPPRRTCLKWWGCNRLHIVVLGVLCDFFFCISFAFLQHRQFAGCGFLLPPTDSCSMLRWKIYFLSRGTSYVGDRLRTPSSR